MNTDPELKPCPSYGTWNKGPANGGAGTAGPRSEEHPGGLWWDGDALLVVVEVTNNKTGEEWLEYHAVQIICDVEFFGVSSLNGDDDCGWPPESWSWWLRLPAFPDGEEIEAIQTGNPRAPITEQPVAQEECRTCKKQYSPSLLRSKLAAAERSLADADQNTASAIVDLRAAQERLAAVTQERDQYKRDFEALYGAASGPDHNADTLTPEQYGQTEGWRLLTKAEVGDYWTSHAEIEAFYRGKWDAYNMGNSPKFTYRTRLTVAELAALRGQR